LSEKLVERIKAPFKKGPTMKVKKGGYKTEARKMTDEEFNAAKKKKQEQVDLILDKISKSGYDSLTKQEKAILFDQSKNG
jgi:DNA invertase Pin-like site-specific DNA recombinase